MDWSANGAVNAVTNQGGCGSCWAFSAVGALEGAFFIKYGQLPTLSVQELVSCDTNDNGCSGGWMTSAFDFTKQNGGLTTDSQYPYTSGSGGYSGECITSGYTNIPQSAAQSSVNVSPTVSAVQAAVTKQPVSIGIDSSSNAFQFYSSGVITTGDVHTLFDYTER